MKTKTHYELDRETGSCLISLGNAQRVRKPMDLLANSKEKETRSGKKWSSE
jgi:hypothetical protein